MPPRHFLIKTWKVLVSNPVLWACKTLASSSDHSDNMNVFSRGFVCLQVPHNPCIIGLEWCSVLISPVAPPSLFTSLSIPVLSLIIYDYICCELDLIRGEKLEKERRSVNNLWVLPTQNWGIMIRLLVPLLCHSVPTVKVSYATEQTETKQLFWAKKLCFPWRHEGGNALPPGQKRQ